MSDDNGRLDEGDINKLSPEMQQRYKDYEDLFAQPGWQRMIGELMDHTGQLVNTALESINDEKSLFFAKGQLRAALAIINLEVGIQAEYQNHLEVLAASQEEVVASQGANA